MIIRFCIPEKAYNKENLLDIGKKTKEMFVCQTEISKEQMKKKFERFMKYGEIIFILKENYIE